MGLKSNREALRKRGETYDRAVDTIVVVREGNNPLVDHIDLVAVHRIVVRRILVVGHHHKRV